MPDDTWVKRVVEEQIAESARTRERERSEAQRREELHRCLEGFRPRFIQEMERVLEEYGNCNGSIPVHVEKIDASSPGKWSVGLRCTADRILSITFTVDAAGAAAEALWIWRQTGQPWAAKRRTFALSTEDAQLLWSGERKDAAEIVREVLEPWLRRLVRQRDPLPETDAQ